MSNNNGNIPLPPTAIQLPPNVQILDGAAADAALAALKASEQAVIEFTPFPEGGYFKYVPRAKFEPQCIIVDSAGTQIAVARNVDIAEFLCNACNCFVIASLMNKVQDEGAAQTIVQPGSPIVLPGGNTPTVFES